MKAVRDRSSALVIYLAETATIDATGLHGDVRALDIRVVTHEIIDANPPDTPFVGGLMTLDDEGVWAIADAERYARAVAPPEADVIAERERRLAAGFIFDFGDGRGEHRIGTTPEDMRRWLDEVTPISQALLNASQPTGEIAIVTDTGPVTITAAEWQSILLAAGQWRQPIYLASFVLQAMDPIPYDYGDDSHWP